MGPRTRRIGQRGTALARLVLAGWAITALVMVVAGWHAIAGLRFPDPDDAMRLLEVRDWIGGQSWWDVGQHRLNGGAFPMHWSRLVDLPLAAVMVVLDPMVGRVASIRIAMVAVPLATLAVVMALVATITRRLAGQASARLAVLVTPLSVALISQMRPMRIDHHGWQVAAALVAAWMLLSRPCARRGAVAGLALAVLLTISLEGLPITVAMMGIAALAWVVQPHKRRGFLLASIWTLAGAAAALQAATRGPAMLAPACDAMAPAWLAALGVAAAALTVAVVAAGAITATGRAGIAARFLVLVPPAGLAAATWLLMAPACLAGPFATLPPQVYDIWYLSVLEGRPLWEQQPVGAAITIGLPLTGLVGTVWAWRRTRGRARDRWSLLLLLLLASTGIAVMVVRAGATANALAVPGAAALLTALLTRARSIATAPRRMLATLATLLMASPGLVVAMVPMVANALSLHRPKASAERADRPPCRGFADVRVMRRLPAATVFAPIDVSPELIVATRHHAIAGGYHRGAAAMAVVTRGFTAPPALAERTIRATGATYLIGCPGGNETEIYATVAPHGLWARLARGERFAWLQPVPMPNHLLVWRISPLHEAAPRP